MKPGFAFLSLAVITVTAPALTAQTSTWTNLTGGSWGTDANWSSTPTFGTDAVLDFSTLNITAATTTTLDGNRTAGTLKFADATTASHDWTVNTGTSGTLTLATTSTAVPEINVSNRIATLNAVLAGSQGFTKTGAGTLVLGNAANTITGAITISAGTLQIRDGSTNTPSFLTAGALSASSISVQSGAVLELPRLHASTATTTTWSLPSISLADGSRLRFRHSTGSNTNNLAANISNTGSTTIDSNGGSYSHNINLSGILSGSGTINYLATSGSGSTTTTRTLTTSNSSTNFSGNWFVDYTGSTSDDYVALQSSAAASLGTGTVTLDDRARLINNAASGINSLSGVVLQKTTSFLDLNGSNSWNNAAAQLTANNGSVNLGSGASSIGTFTLDSTGTVTLGTSTGGTLEAAVMTFKQGTLSGTAPLTGAGTLTKTGTGTATIANTNTLTGGTVIDNGILQINSTGSLGTGSVTIGQTDIGATTHSLRLNGATIGNHVVSKIMYTADFLGSITALGGSVSTINGNVTIQPSLTGAPSRGGHLASTGAGSVLRLMGELNVAGGQSVITHRDGTVEYGGGSSTSYTLQVTNTARLAADNGIGSAVTVALGVSGNATLDLNGYDLQVEGVTRSGNTAIVTNNGAADSSLVLTSSTDREFSGAIQDGATNKVSLVKSGSSTLTLSGSSNYTGDTLVSAGTLLVNGSLGNTAVTVGPAGTIGGDGVIQGALHFDAGAGWVFNPLTTLTVNGTSVSFGGFGIANLVGFTSSVTNGTYTLINGDASFDFANVSNFGEENAYDLGGGRFAYFESGSLNLVVVPEPAACLLGGIAALLLLRRRRN